LPFASHVVVKSDSGTSTPVAHACGHDIHMSVGLARKIDGDESGSLARHFDTHRPASGRTGEGAAAMIKTACSRAFPNRISPWRSRTVLTSRSGQLGLHSGVSHARSRLRDITSSEWRPRRAPQSTIDPVVIAARTVLAFADHRPRENNPLDPVVITVGTSHGGTKNSIIPDEVSCS